MSLVVCQYCDGDWFKQENWFRFLDEPIAPGALPAPHENIVTYRCGTCNEPLNTSRLEVGSVYLPDQ